MGVKNKKIVAIIGFSRSGKDICGDVFIGNGYKRVAFADKVKEDFINLPRNRFKLGFNNGKFHMGLTLQELEENKHLYRKEIIEFAERKRVDEPYYWVDKVKDKIEGYENIVITDLRRLPEIEYLESLKSKGYEVNYINVIRPLNNGGMFDMDGETSKTILWCEYNNLFSVRILNASSVEELIKTTNLVIQDLKL